MPNPIERFTEDPRIELLEDRPLADGDCVLLWVSRTQRALYNRAANLAIALADALDVPVVACFCLVDNYPRATLRAYTFMAEGLAELPDAFAKRGIGWSLITGDPVERIPEQARQRHAAAVVTDLDPIRTGREWRRKVAERLDIPVLVVDSDTVVPSASFPKEEWAPRTIRPKIHRLLPKEIEPPPNPKPKQRSSLREGIDPLEAIASLELDRSVGPAPDLRGGSQEAGKRLEQFLEHKLRRYDELRDDPNTEGTTRLSPYLHFGQISVEEIASRAQAMAGNGAPRAMVDAFLDELIVNRELSINFTLRNPDYDCYAGIPDWGKKTLAEHAADPRPVRYSRAALDEGRTNDPLWNACQRQMRRDGWLNNRLRMYWGKQITLWTESPEEAFEIEVELNDRYFIDGRDPNGYAQIAWAIGGRHDRPFPPNRPVVGIVRKMSGKGQRKYFDVDRYIAEIASRTTGDPGDDARRGR